MKWWQMVTLLISIVSSAVGVGWFIKGEISDVEILIIKVELKHDLDIGLIRDRLTEGGWSRPNQQKWIDLLRPVAEHPIPDVAGIK